MKTFETYNLLPSIQESLTVLGFTTPTEIQAKIFPILLENYAQDVHAQAQTGTGKTLAFGIPLLQAIDPDKKQVQGLVIAPTRELVLQIYESLREVSRSSNIIIEPIYGGMPIDRQITKLKKGVHIVVGTPGRINDLLRRKALKLNHLKILVLDEADIMLDMGFRQEIDEVLSFAPSDRHIWLFSATVMSGIKKLIKSHMKDVVSVKSAQSGRTSEQVEEYYCIVPKRRRIGATIRFIESAPEFYGIIFCRTKAQTAEVMEELASTGLKVNCLHGDMKQTLRNHVIKGFKNKDFNILVATDVAARGIDVSDLTHVINYAIPDDNESYIHRIGRTGRAGKKGIAILFVSQSDMYRLRRLEKATKSKILEISVPPIEAIINAKISAVSDFIEQAKKIEVEPTPVDTAIMNLINNFTEQEIRDSFAVALKETFFQGLDEQKDTLIADSTPIPREICMELGSDKGLEEEQVRSYLYTTCQLLPKEVSKVRVLNKKTFISIPENRLDNCLAVMRKNPIGRKKYKIYLVRDVYRKKSRSGRPRSRDKGRRPRGGKKRRR